jgi:hypothetical protein
MDQPRLGELNIVCVGHWLSKKAPIKAHTLLMLKTGNIEPFHADFTTDFTDEIHGVITISHP